MGPRLAWSVLVLAACANAQNSDAIDAARPPDGSGGGGTTRCNAGELATAIGPTGEVTCAPPAAGPTTVTDGCGVYFGWRDGCNGCTTPPAKWGRVAGDTCTSGAGANNTCTTQTLGADTVRLFGLDPDGDVDGNDKLYGTLHCAATPPAMVTVAPCAAGEFIDGKYGSGWTCASLANAFATALRDHCSLYLGWQDNCDGCTSPPTKWGRAGGTTCMNGIGVDNSCINATLGTEAVNLFGLNPDGDVDNNDKLHIGLHCTTPPAATIMTTAGCPPGHFVVATGANDSFECVSVAPLAVQYFADQCSVYYGWRDNCSGCTTPPTKWGHAKIGACTNGVGADNTCTSFVLGGDAVHLFGLNTDGDVDGNDALYVGFQCRQSPL